MFVNSLGLPLKMCAIDEPWLFSNFASTLDVIESLQYVSEALFYNSYLYKYPYMEVNES